MFYLCQNLLYLDLISFDTSNLTNMDNIFDGCNNLKQMKNIEFNISISKNYIFLYIYYLTYPKSKSKKLLI